MQKKKHSPEKKPQKALQPIKKIGPYGPQLIWHLAHN